MFLRMIFAVFVVWALVVCCQVIRETTSPPAEEIPMFEQNM